MLMPAMKLLLLLLALPLFLLGTVEAADPAARSASSNVSSDEAEKLLKQKKEIVVLDVRTPEEFAKGHLPGAVNVDFHSDDFAKKVAQLDKSKEYLVHCAAGGRSSKACKLMDEQKFGKVYHLHGGFSEWQQAGKPVEK
jgi:phage shock protein E